MQCIAVNAQGVYRVVTNENLGWRQFFAAQASEADAGLCPARVMAVHRGRAEVLGADVDTDVTLSGKAADMSVTVGDWVLVNLEGPVICRRLERFGLFKRRAAGTTGNVQLIAANVDTLFIVTSANRDFNIARLERYLAIAHDAGAHPVIVITKADTVDTVEPFVREASRLSPGLLVEPLDARDAEQVAVLSSWCDSGQTVALVGSSGVGKSTIINTLTGSHQDTSGVREDDQRGRHTTTGRTTHRLPDGGWLIDTPGMRELQLVDVAGAASPIARMPVNRVARCLLRSSRVSSMQPD
jgi:ribosome biogenesis GTPase